MAKFKTSLLPRRGWKGKLERESNYSAMDIVDNGYFKGKWCHVESAKQNMLTKEK